MLLRSSLGAKGLEIRCIVSLSTCLFDLKLRLEGEGNRCEACAARAGLNPDASPHHARTDGGAGGDANGHGYVELALIRGNRALAEGEADGGWVRRRPRIDRVCRIDANDRGYVIGARWPIGHDVISGPNRRVYDEGALRASMHRLRRAHRDRHGRGGAADEPLELPSDPRKVGSKRAELENRNRRITPSGSTMRVESNITCALSVNDGCAYGGA